MRKKIDFAKHVGRSGMIMILLFLLNGFENPSRWEHGWVFIVSFIYLIFSISGILIRNYEED